MRLRYSRYAPRSAPQSSPREGGGRRGRFHRPVWVVKGVTCLPLFAKQNIPGTNSTICCKYKGYTKWTAKTNWFLHKTNSAPRGAQPSPEGRGWPATALLPACAGRERGDLLTPFCKTQNSGNELNDLLQRNDLPEMRSQNELVFAQNELAFSQKELSGGVGGSTGPVRDPIPYPSCFALRKRRSTTRSPTGRGCPTSFAGHRGCKRISKGALLNA